MGIAAIKVKQKVFIVCYGCILGLVMILIFIIGAMISFAAQSAIFLNEVICNVNTNATSYALYGGIDQPFNNVVNNFMCTF